MGDVVDLTIEILKDIREEMRGMRAEQAGMRAEQAGMREELRGVNTRLDGLEAQQERTNLRLDHLIDLSGGAWRDLERRVTILETRLDTAR